MAKGVFTDEKRAAVRIAAICICASIAIICAVLMLKYAMDYYIAQKINDTLAAQYHAESTAVWVTDLPEPTLPTAETMLPAAEAASFPTAVANAPKSTYDPFGGYPNNRYREVSAQFKQLQKTNKDICGWITIGTDLDQAVVQRDNQYYLTRDYTGKSNVNGAIFLDEQVELRQRPTCYILYGHNMKTQAMFGMLHKYDKISYLREHPIITFNTEYEDGEFAVFAVGTTYLDPGSPRYVDYFLLPKADDSFRAGIISRIEAVSDYTISLDVSTEDQLLILVTCSGDDQERRYVAARRLREGENAKSLNMTYLLAEKR